MSKNTKKETTILENDAQYKIVEKDNIKNFTKLVILFGCVSTLQSFLSMLCDVWIIGQIDSEYMHAVGTPLFAMGSLYSLLGFIRISTVASSSKAKYLNNNKEAWLAFFMPAVISILLGVILIICYKPMMHASIFFHQLPESVADMGEEYYQFIIWAAPIQLLNFTIAGWLMGRSAIFKALFIQIIGNVLNISLGIYFTWELGMLAVGVGRATIISQAAMCFIGLIFVFITIPKKNVRFTFKDLKYVSKPLVGFYVYLLLRTLFLGIQIQVHHVILNSLEESLISVNNILMNIVLISSGIFEGIANAVALYSGRAMVEKSNNLLHFIMKMTNIFTIAGGLILAILWVILRVPYAEIISNNIISQEGTIHYSLWLIPYFLFGGFAKTYLGMFLGMLCAKPVAISAFMSLVTFVFIYYVTSGVVLQNGFSGFVALWIAYIGFYIIRSLGLYLYKNSLKVC